MAGGRVIIPPKASTAQLFISFNFVSELSAADQLDSATVTASVWSGTDSNPSAIISGVVVFSFNNKIASQKIIGGVPGVIYLLTCTAVSLTSGQTFVQTGLLAILPAVTP